MNLCPKCGWDMMLAEVFTEDRGDKIAFAGFQCGCGRRSYRASITGPEIPELQWRMGMLSKELGFNVEGSVR